MIRPRQRLNAGGFEEKWGGKTRKGKIGKPPVHGAKLDRLQTHSGQDKPSPERGTQKDPPRRNTKGKGCKAGTSWLKRRASKKKNAVQGGLPGNGFPGPKNLFGG